MMKIRVLDDRQANEEASTNSIKNALKAATIDAQVHPCDHELAASLVKFAAGMRKNDGDNWENEPNTWHNNLEALHDTDVLFIDFQLPQLADHGWLTAEDLAGLFRAFAGIPFVIVLNRFQERDFDLSMLPPTQTAADLHMNDKFLENPGLWTLSTSAMTTGEKCNFRPWQWPSLPQVINDVETCISSMAKVDFTTRILDYFDFSEERLGSLSRSALGILNPESSAPEKATFADFLKNGCVSIDADIRTYLADQLSDDIMRLTAIRIVVSELRRWLNDMVLAAQDTLIDVPHLAQRMPWLVEGDTSSQETWDKYVSLSGNDLFKNSLIKNSFKFDKECWLSKTTYWLNDVQTSPEIDNAYLSFKDSSDAGYVFQEDFSRFAPIAECEEFTAAFNSLWASRYISKAGLSNPDIRYAPKVRLA
ncbi:MAG: hypothetical protein NUV50_08235 [Rhodospirillales bacterium]|nr:hypothetical protein [Rhodospirillales bacterium]